MANKKYFLTIFAGVFLLIFSSSLFAFELKDIVAEINYMRACPQEYASKRLTPRLKNFNGLDYRQNPKRLIATKEGAAPCIECIEVLKKQKPLLPLTMDYVLCKAAAMHVEDQMQTGRTGHVGSDGSHSYDRIERAGFKGTKMGENITYGCFDPIDIVAEMMIDDGVPDRGHRSLLLDPVYDRIGLAYAQGKKVAYGAICVVDMGCTGARQQNTEPPSQSSSKKRDGGQQSVESSRQGSGRKNDYDYGDYDYSDYDYDDYDSDDYDYDDYNDGNYGGEGGV